jgi:hypothetical protein
MAGTPKKRAAMLAVQDKAEEVTRLAEEGKTLREIGEATGLPYQRVHAWVTHADRKEWWDAIRKARASQAAEESHTVLRQATHATIPVDRELSRNLQWLAERLDPDGWGNRPTVAVQVNVAQAFVEAMRLREQE